MSVFHLAPCARQIKAFGTRFGLAATLSVLGTAFGAQAAAQDKSPQKTPTVPITGLHSIRGILKLVDCNARIDEVQVKALGRIAHPEANPNKEFETVYSFLNLKLTRGQRVVVTPELPPSRCLGGKWSPPSRTITAGPILSIDRQDFTFIGSPLTVSVDWNQFSAAFDVTLKLMQIRLNNYATGGSFIKLDLQPLAFFEKKFDIPSIPVPGITPGTIYINDINNDRSLSGAIPDTARYPFTIKLTMVFEAGGGNEIKITGPLPDINIKKMELSTVVTLEPYAASISYKRLSTAFTLRTQTILGWDNPLSIEQKLKPIVVNKMSEFLDDPRLRGEIAKRMKDFLSTRGINGTVIGTTFVTNHSTGARLLKIRYVPFEP